MNTPRKQLRPLLPILLAAGLFASATARAQTPWEPSASPPPGPLKALPQPKPVPEEEPPAPLEQPEVSGQLFGVPDSAPPRALPIGVPTSPLHAGIKAAGSELARYGADSVALIKAPASWTGRDWEKVAGAAFLAGALFTVDKDLVTFSQSNRTPVTDGVANVTKRFGLELAYGIPAGMVAGGLVFKNDRLKDTGRDALEAAVISGILTNGILKPLIGRKRPPDTNGGTTFEFGQSDASFPSGHATQAFAVASVLSARSKGWFVPTLSYSLATLVALDRMNDNKHFASDVFAGAVIGTAVGRFIARRHAPKEEPEPSTKLEVVPIAGGLGMRLSF